MRDKQRFSSAEPRPCGMWQYTDDESINFGDNFKDIVHQQVVP